MGGDGGKGGTSQVRIVMRCSSFISNSQLSHPPCFASYAFDEPGEASGTRAQELRSKHPWESRAEEGLPQLRLHGRRPLEAIQRRSFPVGIVEDRYTRGGRREPYSAQAKETVLQEQRALE